jgi:pyruvate dehydrogenase E1 component
MTYFRRSPISCRTPCCHPSLHGAGRELRGATGAVDSFVGEQVAPTRGPIVITSDYVRAVPEQIRAFLPHGRRAVTLGTDGYGRSDTRAALCRHFEVDAEAIVQTALRALG